MKSKTILIVDDSEFDRGLLVKALSKKGGFRMLEAESGERCLEVLEKEPVDLILMDIMMPGKFGTEILIKIREKMNPIELPIIMVTSKSDASDIIGCLQNGANDYIQKPINFDIALSRILTHLKLSDFSREMSRLKEIAALNSIIVTYNHEINNALAIAIGMASLLDLDKEDPKKKKLENALWRVNDILKQIKEVSETHVYEFDSYGSGDKMIKMKSSK